MLNDGCAKMLNERVWIVLDRDIDMEADKIIVLVVFVVVVMGVTAIQIVLGGGTLADQDIDRHIGPRCADDANALAQFLLDARVDLNPGILGYEVGLVGDHQISGTQLFLEQLLERALVIERVVRPPLNVHRRRVGGKQAITHGRAIHNRDHAVDRDPAFDLGPIEGFDQRLRQRQTRGFDDDMIRQRISGQEGLHGRHEIVGNGAADAAIGKLHDIAFLTGLVAAAEQQLAVDTDIAELVDDQRDAASCRLTKEVLDNAGLAGTEKAGEDGGWNLGLMTKGQRKSPKASVVGQALPS